jgi:hypothetical protein
MEGMEGTVVKARLVGVKDLRTRGARFLGAAPPEDVDVFTLAEVAELLRAPKTRIKNWTIGRPLKIVPRILAGQGKGSRNLYSLEDVYVFALVDRLHRDGLSNEAIRHVLDGVFLTPKLGPVKFFTLVNEKGKWFPRFFQTSPGRWEDVMPDDSGAEADVGPGVYALDVRQLVAWVNARVHALKAERRRKRGDI